MLLEPLVPVSAVWFLGPPERIEVTFNRPLLFTGAGLDAANWLAFAGFPPDRWTTVLATVRPDGVLMVLKVVGQPIPMNPGISYDPPPFDVVDQAGIPAAAFTDFPVT